MDVSSQLGTFAAMIATGIALGLSFDGYRVMRGVKKPHFLVTIIFDMVIWLFAAVLVFGVLLLSNWGEVRFYVYLGLLVGIGVYFCLLSQYMIRILQKIIKVTMQLAREFVRIIKFLYSPVPFCIKKTKAMLKKFINLPKSK